MSGDNKSLLKSSQRPVVAATAVCKVRPSTNLLLYVPPETYPEMPASVFPRSNQRKTIDSGYKGSFRLCGIIGSSKRPVAATAVVCTVRPLPARFFNFKFKS